jgi:hypothetical protein
MEVEIMFEICVTRTIPYVEDLWYTVDTLDEAIGSANDYARMHGVDEVTIYNPDGTVYDVIA